MLHKLKAKMEQAAQAAEQKASAILPNGFKLTVPDDVAEQRYSICKSCEHLYTLTNTCKKCGCFMKLKTTLTAASCPIDKWGKYEYPTQSE